MPPGTTVQGVQVGNDATKKRVHDLCAILSMAKSSMPDIASGNAVPSPLAVSPSGNILVPAENISSETADTEALKNSPDEMPEGWTTYKDMKAAWVLSPEKLPGAVLDDMRGIVEYVKRLSQTSGKEPAPNETVGVYVERVSGKKVTEKTEGKGRETAPQTPKEAYWAGEDLEEEGLKEEVLIPEAVLERWDKAILGDDAASGIQNITALAAITTKKAGSEKPAGNTNALKKPLFIPMKPPSHIAEFMQTSATPSGGRILDTAETAAAVLSLKQRVPTKSASTLSADPLRHYPEPLLADIVERGAEIKKGAWEAVKGRPASETISEGTEIAGYIEELQMKHPLGTAPSAGETTAHYIERLLPTPGQ